MHRGKRYEPVPSRGFAIHNGPDTYNHTLMGDGAWYLLAGDKPRLRLLHRTGDCSYAEPGILPGLGVGGRLRLAVANNGTSKWLDQFESIDTQFAPGIAAWECNDQGLGVGLKLETRPLIGVNGFIATATVHGDFAQAPHLTWAFGAIGDKNDSVELMKDFARLSNPDLPYMEVLAGLVEPGCELRYGALQMLLDANASPAITPQIMDPCALFNAVLPADPHQERAGRFVCAWGYNDYDRKGVADALARLEGRPFADTEWAEPMKKEWFHYWIGRGLNPQKRFLQIRSNGGNPLQESAIFWDASKRIRIKTPDAALDMVLDSGKYVSRLEFRCVASETIFGILGVTLLEASNRRLPI